MLAESEDFPHLIEALDAVMRKLGGVTRRWRFDRMATVCYPASGKLTAAFAGAAKYYGVGVDICPPRHGNRKGVVEKANHSAAQRWWRTLADDVAVEAAQASLDQLTARLDERIRRRDGTRTTAGALAEVEPLRPAPQLPYPAELTVAATVSPQGLVPFRGNFYSVPPGLGGSVMTIRHRLGADTLQIATPGGAVVAKHRLANPGAGRLVRDDGHVVALEKAVLAAFNDAPPCHHKTRRPPSQAAVDEAARLRGLPAGDPAARVVIDLSAYAAAAARLQRHPEPRARSHEEK